MTSVITGDIINSKANAPRLWLPVLKKVLGRTGETPRQWEIFRGDSFQVEIKDVPESLYTAILLKAALRSLKGMDVRLAIGIGDKTYHAKKITESNGSAFIHSGTLLEVLKKAKLEMAIQSADPNFDKEMNLYIKLALIPMNSWSTNAAQAVYHALLNPGKSQEALGKVLGIKQNAVSTRLKRACFEEIVELIEMYRVKTFGYK